MFSGVVERLVVLFRALVNDFSFDVDFDEEMEEDSLESLAGLLIRTATYIRVSGLKR